MILGRVVGTVVATRKDERLVADAIDRANPLLAHEAEAGEIRLTYRELSALIEDAIRSLR